jgi:hypothetical protein
MEADKKEPKRAIGIPAADFEQIQKRLNEGKAAFIMTKLGEKEEVIRDGSALTIKRTGTPVVVVEKFICDRELAATSNWYKLLTDHGRPVLQVGHIAFFMDRASQKSIMLDTLTDSVIGS